MTKLKINLTPSIKNLDIITRGLVSSRVIGSYKSSFRGKGLEFSNYRAYTQDDDAALIDWKASKRTHHILIKEFVEERNLNVFFLLDVSSSMLFGSTNLLKIEYAAELMASLYYTILHAGDSAGFALFNDKIVKKMPPGRGKERFYVLKKTLVDHRLYGGRYDLGYALKFLFHYLKGRGVVIIVSDFIGLKGNWEQALKLVSRKFDVIALMVRDQRDYTLPLGTGQVVVEDPYSDAQILIDPKLIKHDYETHVKLQERHIKSVFSRLKIDLLQLSTHESFIKPLMSFFDNRRARGR